MTFKNADRLVLVAILTLSAFQVGCASDPTAEEILALNTTIHLTVQIGHINVQDDIVAGAVVEAGQLLGYGVIGDDGGDIDLVVRSEPGSQYYLFSIFEEMSADILAEFVDHGVTLDNIVLTKAYRDAHDCGFPEDGSGNGTNADDDLDWVTVQ